jgi:hypothetical protein
MELLRYGVCAATFDFAETCNGAQIDRIPGEGVDLFVRKLSLKL